MTTALTLALRLLVGFGVAVTLAGTFLVCVGGLIVLTMGVLDARAVGWRR